MKKIVNKIKGLNLKKKVQLGILSFLTLALIAIIPVYAWFMNQKKAAELYKVEYPNSLFINAAHREDQTYFELDKINVNEYQLDDNNQIVRDGNNNPVKITKKSYVFTVSGSNTDNYILQMAHTNNNQFTYTLYKATQSTTKPVSGEYVEYKTHIGGTTENTMVFADDVVAEGSTLYYVKGQSLNDAPYNGAYKNVESGSVTAIKSTSNSYYQKTYGDNTNVNAYAVPSYWQATLPTTTGNNKQFCDYYILEVTWNSNLQGTLTKKETDIVTFSVLRQ